MWLGDLPPDVVTAVLLQVPRDQLATTVAALAATNKRTHALLQHDAVWEGLLGVVGERPAQHQAHAQAAVRRSARAGTRAGGREGARRKFVAAFRGIRTRSEIAHIAVSWMCIHAGKLTVGKLRATLKHQQPILVNQLSPSLNSTLLLEVVQARGVYAHAMLRCVVELVDTHGAHPDLPNYDGLTPVMVASARGCARVVEFLVSRGADATHRRGTGDFSPASAASKVVKGTHTALEWAAVMRDAEHRAGCAVARLRCFDLCRQHIQARQTPLPQ